MALDIDYIVAKDYLEEIQIMLRNLPHGGRGDIADDLIKIVNDLKAKYGKSDPFLSDDVAVSRLVGDYLKHGSIVIAYDYDHTVYDWEKRGSIFPLVMDLIKSAKPYARFIVYTHSNLDRHPEIMKYLDQNDLPYDTINEGLIWCNGKEEGKLFYTHFLDDRAGLSASYNILRRAIAILKHNPNDMAEVNQLVKTIK